MNIFRAGRLANSIGVCGLRVCRSHRLPSRPRAIFLALPSLQQQDYGKLFKSTYQDAYPLPLNKYDLSGSSGILTTTASALFSTSSAEDFVTEEASSDLAPSVDDIEVRKENKWPSPVNVYSTGKVYTVFVGGYVFDFSNESKLKSLFTKFGDIQSVMIPLQELYKRDPGNTDSYRYAFIHFKTVNGMSKALKQGSIETECGNIIEIKDRSKSRREVENERTFFMKDLPSNVTVAEIVDVLKEYGDIELVNIVLNAHAKTGEGEYRSYGFVVFRTVLESDTFFNDSFKLRDEMFSITKVNKNTKAQRRDRSQKILIENLGTDCTEESLHNYFSTYGDVRYVRMLELTNDNNISNSAIVQFNDSTHAFDACREISHNINGNFVSARCLGWLSKD